MVPRKLRPDGFPSGLFDSQGVIFLYIELKTERLLLRPLGIGELASTHVYAGDAENTRFMLWRNDSIDKTRAFLERVEADWAKESPDEPTLAMLYGGEHIGHISLFFDESRTQGELGWILNPHFHGRGFASEAAAALRDYALGELGLTRLIAHCDCRNIASYRVMEHIGMTLIDDKGTRPYLADGKPVGELTYEIVSNTKG